jgi:hypothetical protein
MPKNKDGIQAKGEDDDIKMNGFNNNNLETVFYGLKLIFKGLLLFIPFYYIVRYLTPILISEYSRFLK